MTARAAKGSSTTKIKEPTSCIANTLLKLLKRPEMRILRLRVGKMKFSSVKKRLLRGARQIEKST